MSILEFLTVSEKLDDKKVRENFERWQGILNQLLQFIHIGSGAPENNETGSVGHLFLRTDGGANTSVYVKESGTDTKTGWVAK
jgi:hypothetical protein